MDISKPETISRFKKQRHLLGMSESQFRDEVIRPIFLRQGFADGRDVCGPFEKGKDAVFLSTDRLGMDDVYVVQTKRGDINLARKASSNLIEATTQLKTALQTKVPFVKTKKKQLPTKVALCVSGKINDAARQHIVEEIGDPRILFMDSDELIPRIDDLFPELWLGIDAQVAPYFRKLKELIELSDDSMAMAELLPRESQVGIAADQSFVMLQLYRMVVKLKKISGQMKKVPEFVQLPITGLLSKRKQLSLVLGGAGSGKSTSLKRLAYVLATRALKFDSPAKATIPILLRALDIASRPDHSLVEVCDLECKKLTGLSASSFSSEDLSAGRVFVLVDALDEIAAEESRVAVLSSIKEFHRNYPECSAVVTSRDSDSVKSLSALKEFDAYNLSPINHKQAHQMVKMLQKGKSLPPEKSQELVRRLDEVHGMELSPLLVTVFAATSEYSRQDIPANITELFKKFTEMMLGRWDASKGFKQQYHAPLKDFILTKIAFEMHKRKLTHVDRNTFDGILKSELENRGYKADTEQLRDEILNRSGLFIVGEAIEFRHLMMQEFFAGRGIPSLEYLNTVVADPWWRGALIFYFGEHPDDSGALHSAIAALRERSVEENYYSALAIGLALQACYLVEVKDKLDIYKWVVDHISAAKDEFLAAEPSGRFPLRRFIFYYLFGRDSVALSVLESRVRDILDKWNLDELSKDEREIRTFWIICGLIECGAMTDAEQLLEDYNPSDSRYLLGIHLGSFLMQKVRVSTKAQYDCADRICDRISGQINHLRGQLIEEMKSELLEVREGAIETIGLPAPDGNTKTNEN